jgi:hypothetical protein
MSSFFKNFSTIFLVILCFIWGCENLPKDDYNLSWNLNPEPDISHYIIYGWHGADTTRSPFRDDTLADNFQKLILKNNISHNPSDSVVNVSVSFVANGDWLQFAVSAVNTYGLKSNISISSFIQSDDLRSKK